MSTQNGADAGSGSSSHQHLGGLGWAGDEVQAWAALSVNTHPPPCQEEGAIIGAMLQRKKLRLKTVRWCGEEAQLAGTKLGS